MGIDVHTIEQIGNTSTFSRTDRVLIAHFPQQANPAAAGEGDSVTVSFSGLILPQAYSVLVSGLSQIAIPTVTNRTFTGFNVVLNPLTSTVTLAIGTFDVEVFA
jgi:hypothetical protein